MRYFFLLVVGVVLAGCTPTARDFFGNLQELPRQVLHTLNTTQNRALRKAVQVRDENLPPSKKVPEDPLLPPGFVLTPARDATQKKGCFIKGNINLRSREKRYYLLNHPRYSSIKIDAPGERRFCTELEARSQGFIRAE